MSQLLWTAEYLKVISNLPDILLPESKSFIIYFELPNLHQV